MSGIWLPGGALVLSIFLVIIFFVKGSIKNNETKMYSILVILNLLFSLLGLIIYIFAMKVGNLYVTGVFQSLYLAIMDLMLFYMLRYVIELNNFKVEIYKIMKIIFSIITLGT